MLYGHAPSWRAQTFSTHPVPSSVSTSTQELRQAMSRFTAIPSGPKPTRRPPLSLRNPESAATVAASRAGACLSSFAAISALTPAAGTHPVALTTPIAHAHALDLIGIAGLGNPEPAVAIPGHADRDRDLVEADADRRRQAADDRRAGIGRRAHRLALLVEVVRPALEAAFDRAVGRRARGLRRRESGPADERKHQKQSPHATLPETETVA